MSLSSLHEFIYPHEFDNLRYTGATQTIQNPKTTTWIWFGETITYYNGRQRCLYSPWDHSQHSQNTSHEITNPISMCMQKLEKYFEGIILHITYNNQVVNLIFLSLVDFWKSTSLYTYFHSTYDLFGGVASISAAFYSQDSMEFPIFFSGQGWINRFNQSNPSIQKDPFLVLTFAWSGTLTRPKDHPYPSRKKAQRSGLLSRESPALVIMVSSRLGLYHRKQKAP